MESWSNRIGLLFAICLLSALVSAGQYDHAPHKHEQNEMRHLGVHVHGVAELRLAIEGKTVLVEFETPAANVVGFEHKPRNDEQKRKLAAAINILKDFRNLLVLEDGGCSLVSVEVVAPFTEEGTDSDHSDFDAGYELACNSADEIVHLQLTLFKHFPGFEKIKVEWVTDSGQGAAEATAADYKVSLK